MYGYEIHITVEQCEIDHFKRYCGDAGVKPLLIDLQQSGQSIGHHLMCSHRSVTNDFGQVVTTACKIVRMFTERGLNVQRIKIETIIDNPISQFMRIYYETHVPIVVNDHEMLEYIKHNNKDWHVSKNAFKTVDAGQVYFLTCRSNSLYVLNVRLQKLDQFLRQNNIIVNDDKIEKECVLVDSNRDMDAAWLNVNT